jgi:chaperonin GroES
MVDMKIVPLGANIVIKRLSAEEMTAGGIVLPQNTREKSRQGRVLSLGDGRVLPSGALVPHQVREGDRVLFDPYAGAEMTLDGDELLILDENEILAVVP